MDSTSEPVTPSFITPRATETQTPQPKREDPPRPINFVVIPISRDRQIENALKTQRCCCCNLHIGLTIGFFIIFLLSVLTFDWLSISQFICVIIGIIGVWVNAGKCLTVAKFILYLSVIICIVKFIINIFITIVIVRDDQSLLAGAVVFALLQIIGIVLHFVMISYINAAIIVMDKVHRQMNNIQLHTV